MQGAHIAHVGDLGAAEHTFPDDCLLFIVNTASFLSKADLLQQTSHAVNFLVSLAFLIRCLSLTVDQSSKEGLQAGLTLIVGAALHGVLLRLLEEGIIRVTEALIFKNPLTFGLFEGELSYLTFERS